MSVSGAVSLGARGLADLARVFPTPLVHFNVRELLQEVNRATRAEMGTREERRFYDKYVRQMKISIDAEGNLRLKLQD